jgi:error-prone DNA polymerase
MHYVELHARSAFSFLRGAAAPEQLAEGAARLNLPAIALCDRDGVYGAPRLFASANEAGVRAIVGAELTLEDETILPVLVETRRGYQNLCRLLTRAHLRSEKGTSRVRWDELPEFAEGLVALTGDDEGPVVRAIVGQTFLSAGSPDFPVRCSDGRLESRPNQQTGKSALQF